MKSLDIGRATLDDPLYSQKNPHQTFLLLFSLFAGLPVVLGGESASAALDDAVSPALVTAWASSLLVGSLIALVGEFWRGHTWHSLIIERAGLSLVGTGGAFYSVVLYCTVPDPAGARYVVGITAAYALSCLWRCVQITRRLRWIRGVVEEVNQAHE